MASLEQMPEDPVALARDRAEQATGTAFEMSTDEKFMLAELDVAAEGLGFINKTYFLETYRGVAVPTTFESQGKIEYIDFHDLVFEGRFVSYAKLHIGRLLGAGSVRAVCLAFTDTTLLPYFDTIPEDKLLLVPALAVGSISDTTP